MSSYNVVITEAAQRDLLDIFDYITFELREPDSASRLLAKIRSKVNSLEEFPERNNLIIFENINYFVDKRPFILFFFCFSISSCAIHLRREILFLFFVY